MKASLQKLKTKLEKAVSSLSPENKAELYFQKRKHAIKVGMQGEQKKFMEMIKKCDEFYNEHAEGTDYYTFHNAHHKFLDWQTDYIYFRQYQHLLAEADREKDIYKFDLQIMETLEYLLRHQKELGSDFAIGKTLEVVSKVKERAKTAIKEYDETIPQLEQQVETDANFKKNDYFKDIDNLGYKNLSWNEYLVGICNTGTKNGSKEIIGKSLINPEGA